MIPCNALVSALHLIRPRSISASSSWDNCILLSLGVAMVITPEFLVISAHS